MLKISELSKEKYEEALEKSIKALAQRYDLSIGFSEVEHLDLNNNSVVLPAINSENDLQYLRGLSDSYAFQFRFHDSLIAKSNLNFIEQKLFDLFEQVRCEALGMQIYPGAKQNLEYKFLQDIRRLKGLELEIYSGFHQYLKDVGINKSKNLNNLSPIFTELKRCLNDPKQFTIQVISFVKSLKLKIAEEKIFLTSSQIDSEASANEGFEQGGEQQELINTQLAMVSTEASHLNPGGFPKHFEFLDDTLVDYKIFTEEFDEIVEAEDLESIDKLNSLRHQLDLKTIPHRRAFERMAQKFRQKLLSKKYCKWERFLDEGILDSKTLASFIADPEKSDIFKRLKEDNFNDTVLTLLIDNSGSMRGLPIATAAVIADLLSKSLDSLQIKTEVVGYTTANWKGGKSFAKWLQLQSPNQPGRLGELRHIIYKKAYSSWRKSKRNFGLMIKEGILKENIDGEALKWAAKRILAMPQKRKILVVISDGAPLDEVTAANNSKNYLGSHLMQMTTRIDKMPLKLFAIGIGHDVSKFYKNSLVIENHEVLGKALFERLIGLITT